MPAWNRHVKFAQVAIIRPQDEEDPSRFDLKSAAEISLLDSKPKVVGSHRAHY